MIKKWKEILMVIVGSMMMGASIDLFVQADFGLDPLSLFQAGLGRVLHLSLGTTSQVLMISIIILLFFIDRKRIGIGSILNSVLVGTFIKWFSPMICTGGGAAAERLLCLLAGLILMGVGIGTYVAAGLGEAGMDAMMMYLHGSLLTGNLGCGSVVSIVVNGYMIPFTSALFGRTWKNRAVIEVGGQ